MEKLFVASNKEAEKIGEVVGLEPTKPEFQVSPNYSMSPAKAGMIYGQFHVSPVKTIKVQKAGGIVVDIPLTRHERRLLARRVAKHG